jgi:hypothetical protein
VTPSVTTTYSIECTGDGESASDSVTVTVNPEEQSGTLLIKKVVIRDNGGTAATSTFSFQIDGGATTAFEGDGENSVTVSVGTHTVTEVAASGFTTSYDNCENVDVADDETETCTITNNDIAETGTLVVKKVVVRDNGGTAATSTFSFRVNGEDSIFFDDDGEISLTRGVGEYTIIENPHSGFASTTDNCTGIALASGETETCTITNNDIAPATTTLTLVKSVVNDNGGTTTPTAWTLSADGPTDISGVSGSAAVTNASVTAGSYALSEGGGPDGYASSGIYSCQKNDGPDVEGNTIVLEEGDDVVCTITNNDQAGTLVVKKNVIRDDGGTTATTTFAFQIDGGATTTFEGDGENIVAVNAGMHSVTEPAVDGWTTTMENCTNVFVGNGATTTCTITNDDEEPAQTVDHLLISEVYYDVDGAHGADQTNEWIEIFNPTASTVNLTNWWIQDGTNIDKIPNGTTISAGGLLVLTAASTTSGFWGATPMVSFENLIGNGLANGGDAIRLLNATGATTTVDAMSYGSNVSVFNPSVPVVAEGHSLFRSSLLVDTDTATDWVDDATPSPNL